MKILIVNKFLYPKGGAETYVLKLGKALQDEGYEVQYFGMDSQKRIVGNSAEAYTAELDFHGRKLLTKLGYPFRIIYSAEARKKIREVLETFRPDVCHLNNFNYQLTPSIILEVRKWEKESGHKCRIIYTAHDPQLVCPNHMCMNPNTRRTCEKCLDGHFFHCFQNKCIHSSYARSLIGTMEAVLWNSIGVYEQLDTIICCSAFIKTLLDRNSVLSKKTVVLHNFIEEEKAAPMEKKGYVLYFGRYSKEKGIETLVKAARSLPEILFVFAGAGELEPLIEGVPNIQNVGFCTGEVLKKYIGEAEFSVIPSEWYENCPFSVLESISLGTPVLGANIGGIPELILESGAGTVFESGNMEELMHAISSLRSDPEKLEEYRKNCGNDAFDSVKQYITKLLPYYTQQR